jgi:hypothetical protein
VIVEQPPSSRRCEAPAKRQSQLARGFSTDAPIDLEAPAELIPAASQGNVQAIKVAAGSVAHHD